MRAAVIRQYRADLSLETVPDPVCEADGVVVKVLACGICRSDWHGWAGEHAKVKPGAIPGHEYCGEVVETGLTDQVLDDPQHPYTRSLLDAVLGA